MIYSYWTGKTPLQITKSEGLYLVLVSSCLQGSEKHFTFQTQVLVAIKMKRNFTWYVIESLWSFQAAARAWARWGQQGWNQSWSASLQLRLSETTRAVVAQLHCPF